MESTTSFIVVGKDPDEGERVLAVITETTSPKVVRDMFECFIKNPNNDPQIRWSKDVLLCAELITAENARIFSEFTRSPVGVWSYRSGISHAIVRDGVTGVHHAFSSGAVVHGQEILERIYAHLMKWGDS